MTLASESLPLSGLKVLSLEFYGAGPFCTQYLSTFGAGVIKIENSTQGGDFARTTVWEGGVRWCFSRNSIAVLFFIIWILMEGSENKDGGGRDSHIYL